VWRCDLICSKPDAASAAPGPCEDNALAIPGLSRGNGANAAYCKFGDSMNAKTDRGAVKPLASQEKLFSYSMIGSITTSKSSRDQPRSSARSMPVFSTPLDEKASSGPALQPTDLPSLLTEQIAHFSPLMQGK
jgi:hypothetical protein